MRYLAGQGVREIEFNISVTRTPDTTPSVTRLNSSGFNTTGSLQNTIEGGTRPVSLDASGINNGTQPTTANRVFDITTKGVYIGNSGTTTGSIAFTLASPTSNPWKIAFTEGATKTLTFNLTQSAIPWVQWNNGSAISTTGVKAFDLARIYLFSTANTTSLPPGGIIFANKQASIDESSVIAINVENKDTRIYPLPKAIPITYMSTSSANTSFITKELQFNVAADFYNDAATGVANAPSYVNIFLVSSYVSPSSTLTNLQLIQRTRQVWLNG